MKVLVCGSRDWANAALIRVALKHLKKEHGPVTVVHGDCKTGADAFAAQQALLLDLSRDRHVADWRRHGKAAGPIRNLAMLDTKPDLVLAFQRDGSRGTQHTIDEARKRGIPVEVHVE
jgi:hypothetical protein